MPDCGETEEGNIEIRQIFEMEDFAQHIAPQLRAQEERQRASIAANQ
jgi:hypothetical protein